MVDEVRRRVPVEPVPLQEERVAEVARDDGARPAVDGQLRRVGADGAPEEAVPADDRERTHGSGDRQVGRERGQGVDQGGGVRPMELSPRPGAVGPDGPHRVW